MNTHATHALPLERWLLPREGSRKKLWTLAHTQTAMEDLFGEDLHLARVRSLANGVAGVLNASVVSIAGIGRAYAAVRGIESKSGIKQGVRLHGDEPKAADSSGLRSVRG